MDYEFLTGLTPRLLDIVYRDDSFWDMTNYELVRNKTRLNILAWVHSGTGSIDLNGQLTSLYNGVLFLIQPGSRLIIRTQPRNTLNFYSIQYQCKMVKWEGGHARIEEISRNFPFPQVMDVLGNPQLRALFQNIYDVWQRKDIGYTWNAKLKFMNLLGHLGTIQEEWNNDAENDSRQAIIYLLEYIKDHLHEHLDRSTLANSISISPAYFSVLFKKHTGLTLTDYILKLRLDRAKEILRDSSMKVSDVARIVGFADPYYFTRMFKKEIGLSPREYRKS